jgi:hypothetical protein
MNVAVIGKKILLIPSAAGEDSGRYENTITLFK